MPGMARDTNEGGTVNKRFFITWAVIFVAWMIGSIVVHGVLLHDDYAKLPNLMRPEAEAQRYFPLMILAHIIMSGAFAWIYSRGVEDAPWAPQGIRYGVAVALLAIVPMYLIYYVVQPMPGVTVAKQIVFDSIVIVILGLIAAFLYRSPARA
jgi:hypothetical protein